MEYFIIFHKYFKLYNVFLHVLLVMYIMYKLFDFKYINVY